MKTLNIASSAEYRVACRAVRLTGNRIEQGRLNVIQRHNHDTQQFEPLLAEFVALGKQAAMLEPERRSSTAEELLTIRSKASIVIDKLLACCRQMDHHDERRRFLAITLIFTSARGINLLDFNLLQLLDEILPTGFSSPEF